DVEVAILVEVRQRNALWPGARRECGGRAELPSACRQPTNGRPATSRCSSVSGHDVWPAVSVYVSDSDVPGVITRSVRWADREAAGPIALEYAHPIRPLRHNQIEMSVEVHVGDLDRPGLRPRVQELGGYERPITHSPQDREGAVVIAGNDEVRGTILVDIR